MTQINCKYCGKTHGAHDEPGTMCKWCEKTVRLGTRHHPTEPCCDCDVEKVDYKQRAEELRKAEMHYQLVIAKMSYYSPYMPMAITGISNEIQWAYSVNGEVRVAGYDEAVCHCLEPLYSDYVGCE